MSRNERNGIAPRFYSSRIFSTVGKIFVESNRDGEITVTRFKDSIRVQERIYIYIYKYLRDTSYDGRFVETMAARWGTKDRLYRCEVYYRREISPTREINFAV